MKNKSYFKKGITLFKDFAVYFYRGWKSRLLWKYTTSFVKTTLRHLDGLRHSLYIKGLENVHTKDEKIERLHRISSGLYSLLPVDPRFSYSVLFSIDQPHPSFLKKSLESILVQRVPSVEVLIGLVSPPSAAIQTVLAECEQQYPGKIRTFDFSDRQNGEWIENELAEQATGHFLFVMGQEDWVRPDLFFRFDQTLRIFAEPEKVVLYCDHNQMNDLDYFIPRSIYQQPSKLLFPYFFRQFMQQGLLVPKNLWLKVGGLNPLFQGAEYENLLLNLDVAGAAFQHIPCALYALRASAKRRHPKSQEAFVQALENYSQAKQLEWTWTPGYRPDTARAIPEVNPHHCIQIIMPYKDQKEMTLRAIRHVLQQKEVKFKITAVDNNSTDLSIAEEIKRLGGEVISIHEPFHYSRLNNLAVQKTQTAADCDVLLFLNNDVDLAPDALSEMLRWIDQPQIGIVGCRLNYPDGTLQHGGVKREYHGIRHMGWSHIEKFRDFKKLDETKTLGVFDAVTAACAMMKRDLFLQVGGFDETWYPIAYSDTNLAVKLEGIGLKSFYTPYAVGVHYESVSRHKLVIEDYEETRWLHQLLIANQKIVANAQTLIELNK